MGRLERKHRSQYAARNRWDVRPGTRQLGRNPDWPDRPAVPYGRVDRVPNADLGWVGRFGPGDRQQLRPGRPHLVADLVHRGADRERRCSRPGPAAT